MMGMRNVISGLLLLTAFLQVCYGKVVEPLPDFPFGFTPCTATTCLQGFKCIERVNPCFVPPCEASAECVPKIGACPHVSPDTFGVCVEACNSDADCSGCLKCCSNGCGHTCQKPV